VSQKYWDHYIHTYNYVIFHFDGISFFSTLTVIYIAQKVQD